MSYTYTQAREQMRQVFYDNFAVSAATLLGYAVDIRWQNVERANIPDGSKFWCRHSTQTVMEGQVTLSDNAGLPGQKRYGSTGLIFVQLFMPKSHVNADSLLGQLAEIAKNAYRRNNVAGSVWYYRARINELPPEEDYFRVNVVVEFEYEELH